MQTHKPKQYAGNIQLKEGKYGEYLQIGYSKKDLELMLENLNERGYVNLVQATGKEGNQYQYILEPQQGSPRATTSSSQPEELTDEELADEELAEIPF